MPKISLVPIGTRVFVMPKGWAGLAGTVVGHASPFGGDPDGYEIDLDDTPEARTAVGAGNTLQRWRFYHTEVVTHRAPEQPKGTFWVRRPGDVGPV